MNVYMHVHTVYTLIHMCAYVYRYITGVSGIGKSAKAELSWRTAKRLHMPTCDKDNTGRISFRYTE
jgi:hypothetical protein